MLRRFGVMVMVMVMAALAATRATATELRQSAERPDLVEIGDPIMISRDLLAREMARNLEMKAYITDYGWPDYAEIQEVQVEDPFAAYEVRMYYLRRNRQLVYGRVNVSPAFQDFGVRKYEGPIPAETLNRLLTAAPTSAEAFAPPAQAEEILGETDEVRAPEAVAYASSDPVELAVKRLEAAADRASLAAEMAERSSQAAQASADRATAVVQKLIQK